MTATHATMWRGRAIAAGDVIDTENRDFVELLAHGFRLEDGAAAAATDAHDVESLSRKELIKLLKGRGHGNLFVKSTVELRALACGLGGVDDVRK